ncbi:Serine/threonine-protein kinase PknD [uncultured archaeon]|nr:Serine/threonine-protein kinase PknD [uncultured archaeon]
MQLYISDSDYYWIEGEDPIVSLKEGDRIGLKYEVKEILGIGGISIVYLVYSHETNSVYALKTFQDKYLSEYLINEGFKKEASTWMDIGYHPHIVQAYYLENINEHIYIAMEYISPGNDGINSIEKYIKSNPQRDIIQIIRWAIQFCFGIEYAYSKGLRAHRDIKPDNILIDQNRLIKISDFGFPGIVGNNDYISPEQRDSPEICDEKSDIYSFGIVLHELIALKNHSKFLYFNSICRDDKFAKTFLEFTKLPIYLIIKRCIEREPDDRYSNFSELRKDLEKLLKRLNEEEIKPPVIYEQKIEGLCNKALSLYHLGRYSESIDCCDEAIKINSQFPGAYLNKGLSLQSLGRCEEAIGCYDNAIRLNSIYGVRDDISAYSWNSKGLCYSKLENELEAKACYENAIKIDPLFPDPLINIANCLIRMNQLGKAFEYIEGAYKANPNDIYFLNNMGYKLESIGEYEEAIKYYERANKISPLFSPPWFGKGCALRKLYNFSEAIECFENASRNNSDLAAQCHGNKSLCLLSLNRIEEAFHEIKEATKRGPNLAEAWLNRSSIEFLLGMKREPLHSLLNFFSCAKLKSSKDLYYVKYALNRIIKI